MAFTFKQFHIDDMNCGMAVSTDGVLLGAWAPLINAKRILDIGAGCGLLSLIAAQRSQAEITGVELDNSAAIACQHNFDQSPWKGRLNLVCSSIQNLSQQLKYQNCFDHIICNPPYFEYGPQALHPQRAMARHTDSLSFSALIKAIDLCLTPQGQASLIIPFQSLPRFSACIAQSPLTISKQIFVKSVTTKTANRVLVLLDKAQPTDLKQEEFIIRDCEGNYTEQMIELTKEFYLKM